MRHIFHEILARYLSTEQFAFDTTTHELWPDARPTWHPEVRWSTQTPAAERGRHTQVYRDLEPQS